MNDLRPYQTTTIDNIRASLRGGVRRLVLQAPTGSGKTIIAAEIAALARAKQNKLAFVVPAIALIDQTVEEFYDAGVRDVGVIQANHHMTDWAQPIQVCSVQTLERRETWPEANVVIFDECHRVHEAHKRWITDPAWAQVPFIGMSATPWTRGLGKMFESLLIATTTQDLIEAGYLSKFRVFATGHPDLTGVRTVAGDFHDGDLSQAMNTSILTADIIKTWQQHWGKPNTLVFAVDRLHAKSLQARFEWAGVKCGYQDAATPPSERADIKRKFHSGELPVVVNIMTLTTGVDWDVRCVVLARPTKSEMLYVQIIGRALRTAEGKMDALILDHSDSTQRLGFVTDIFHDELDGHRLKGKAEPKKPPLPVDCEACGYIMPRKLLKCPNCGRERQSPKCSLMENDGQLVELVRDGTMWMAFKVKPALWTKGERKTFFAELMRYGIDHGYKPGWAAMKYRDKFGEWPPRNAKFWPPASRVSETVGVWIRSRNRAWLRTKQQTAEAAE
jgi:superfamily II DNA or RNA helicase